MTKTKKMLMSVLVVVMISCCIVAAGTFAASQGCYITKGDGPVHSGAITATNGARSHASNYEVSGHKLYADLQYSSGSGWTNERTVLINIGVDHESESWRPGHLLWRIQLNPQYAFRDCYGFGYVQNH